MNKGGNEVGKYTKAQHTVEKERIICQRQFCSWRRFSPHDNAMNVGIIEARQVPVDSNRNLLYYSVLPHHELLQHKQNTHTQINWFIYIYINDCTFSFSCIILLRANYVDLHSHTLKYVTVHTCQLACHHWKASPFCPIPWNLFDRFQFKQASIKHKFVYKVYIHV